MICANCPILYVCLYCFLLTYFHVLGLLQRQLFLTAADRCTCVFSKYSSFLYLRIWHNMTWNGNFCVDILYNKYLVNVTQSPAKNNLITKLLSKFLVWNFGEYVNSQRLMSIVFNHLSGHSYHDRLRVLGLESLERRCLNFDLILVYKILRWCIELKWLVAEVRVLHGRRRGTCHKCVHQWCLHVHGSWTGRLGWGSSW